MSRYQELRHYFNQPIGVRIALLRQELIGHVHMAHSLVHALTTDGARERQLLARIQELTDILNDSVVELEKTVRDLPVDGSVTGDEQVRMIRHDLRGRIGTLLGATGVLQNICAEQGADRELLSTVQALRASAGDMRDVFDALMEEAERGV